MALPSTDAKSLLADLEDLEKLREPYLAEGKRRFQRFVVRGEADLICVDRSRLDQRPLSIQLRDISRAGLGFLCDSEIEVGSIWRVAFLHNGFCVGEQALIIRHCRLVRAGIYLLGAQFCIESGLMYLMGIDPAAIRDGDNPAQSASAPRFLSPTDMK